MNQLIQTALENIYISPLELCNLNCKLCYTNKVKNILSNKKILGFVNRYDRFLRNHDFFSALNAWHSPEKKNSDNKESASLKSILFCGGEVFTLPNFPRLINKLIKKNIFITVITNGTIDRLNQIKSPQNCQLLVSLDGPKDIHDANRGSGNFNKSIKFIRHAINLGFPVEIMFLVTPESYPYKDSFVKILSEDLDLPISKVPRLNYITQKTVYYTDQHPLSNQNNRKPALTKEQIVDIKRHYNSVPAKNFGCFQLTLQSNGLIYGCCESPAPLSKISSSVKKTVRNFLGSLSDCQLCAISSLNRSLSTNSRPSVLCNGCTNPEFLCGYKKELRLLSCTDVVKSFNK